jgi:hypothetical protein
MRSGYFARIRFASACRFSVATKRRFKSELNVDPKLFENRNATQKLTQSMFLLKSFGTRSHLKTK